MSVVKLKGMPSYEIFGKFYDAVMGDGSESATRVSELIRVSRPDARKVLELGCGTGSILRHCREILKLFAWISLTRCSRLPARRSLKQNSGIRIWSISKS